LGRLLFIVSRVALDDAVQREKKIIEDIKLNEKQFGTPAKNPIITETANVSENIKGKKRGKKKEKNNENLDEQNNNSNDIGKKKEKNFDYDGSDSSDSDNELGKKGKSKRKIKNSKKPEALTEDNTTDENAEIDELSTALRGLNSSKNISSSTIELSSPPGSLSYSIIQAFSKICVDINMRPSNWTSGFFFFFFPYILISFSDYILQSLAASAFYIFILLSPSFATSTINLSANINTQLPHGTTTVMQLVFLQENILKIFLNLLNYI
jgi:hypothetical protein